MLAHFAHHLLTALPIPLLPLIRSEFRLDYTQAGLVVFVFNLAYGIGQLPAGWLADRIGTRVLITVGICGVAVAGILVGLSQTYLMMMVFLVLMGVLGGGYHPSAAPLISKAVEPKNLGRALGFHLIGGSGSFFLAPLIAAGIATAWGWRGPFIGLAVPTVIFGIIFYLLLGGRVDTRPSREIVSEVPEEEPSPVGRWRRLAVFMVLTIFTQAVTFSTIAFIPLFIVDNFGVSEEVAATFLSIIYSAGLWASPLGGYLSDRFGRLRVVLLACLIISPLIYLLNLVSYGPGIGALLLVIGMVMYIRMPASESYVISQTTQRRRSTVLGIYYFTGMEAGAVFAPIMGFLIDRFGFHTSFSIGGIAIAVVTIICSGFLWRSREQISEN